MKRAYGAVAFDDQGRILLREPKDHFDGNVWTFAKGRADANELPQATALRELEEETGFTGTVAAEIPGLWQGTETKTTYFVVLFPERARDFDDEETASIRWAHPEEALGLLSLTTNERARTRDLGVLEAALALVESLKASIR